MPTKEQKTELRKQMCLTALRGIAWGGIVLSANAAAVAVARYLTHDTTVLQAMAGLSVQTSAMVVGKRITESLADMRQKSEERLFATAKDEVKAAKSVRTDLAAELGSKLAAASVRVREAPTALTRLKVMSSNTLTGVIVGIGATGAVANVALYASHEIGTLGLAGGMVASLTGIYNVHVTRAKAALDGPGGPAGSRSKVSASIEERKGEVVVLSDYLKKRPGNDHGLQLA